MACKAELGPVVYTRGHELWKRRRANLPDAEDPDPDVDAESLQRSRDAIDEGREAAREALKDEVDWTSDTPEEPPSAEESGAEKETGAG